MQAPPLIALEIVLGFVVPIGWALRELASLRRERRRDLARAKAGAALAIARGRFADTAALVPARSGFADTEPQR